MSEIHLLNNIPQNGRTLTDRTVQMSVIKNIWHAEMNGYESIGIGLCTKYKYVSRKSNILNYCNLPTNRTNEIAF